MFHVSVFSCVRKYEEKRTRSNVEEKKTLCVGETEAAVAAADACDAVTAKTAKTAQQTDDKHDERQKYFRMKNVTK